ncbi:uncharacterized protein SPPG_02755 [Spizellomyces punctatus DAOM BR117]|uniref:Structure-specific endonuclease subunit SLX4 n=1 Tax=Spizellomyces punctatus (strain DAOM BR117) TaxID=645134 RepID=A0A0L0HME2_SPIPD|nr:uncharacterized protein SPPG_02755 [Spizellomyces punctatus DAOM BR117]KND02277.1 hypothetical protein SPPG_02755 [Spizellomyces punctatus DAOM BR117]|eukprot:XP_016610316.1 hypothetical protein SPPG_02755 [Spizellomyces punctatus DAOM BR117]
MKDGVQLSDEIFDKTNDLVGATNGAKFHSSSPGSEIPRTFNVDDSDLCKHEVNLRSQGQVGNSSSRGGHMPKKGDLALNPELTTEGHCAEASSDSHLACIAVDDAVEKDPHLLSCERTNASLQVSDSIPKTASSESNITSPPPTMQKSQTCFSNHIPEVFADSSCSGDVCAIDKRPELDIDRTLKAPNCGDDDAPASVSTTAVAADTERLDPGSCFDRLPIEIRFCLVCSKSVEKFSTIRRNMHVMRCLEAHLEPKEHGVDPASTAAMKSAEFCEATYARFLRFCPFCGTENPWSSGGATSGPLPSKLCCEYASGENTVVLRKLVFAAYKKLIASSTGAVSGHTVESPHFRVSAESTDSGRLEYVWIEVDCDNEENWIPRICRERIRQPQPKSKALKTRKKQVSTRTRSISNIIPVEVNGSKENIEPQKVDFADDVKPATRSSDTVVPKPEAKITPSDSCKPAKSSKLTTRRSRKRKSAEMDVQLTLSKIEGMKRQRHEHAPTVLPATEAKELVEQKISAILHNVNPHMELDSDDTMIYPGQEPAHSVDQEVPITSYSLWQLASTKGEISDIRCTELINKHTVESRCSQALRPPRQLEDPSLSQEERKLLKEREARVVTIRAVYDGQIRRREQELEAEIRALRARHLQWVRDHIKLRDKEIAEVIELAETRSRALQTEQLRKHSVVDEQKEAVDEAGRSLTHEQEIVPAHPAAYSPHQSADESCKREVGPDASPLEMHVRAIRADAQENGETATTEDSVQSALVTNKSLPSQPPADVVVDEGCEESVSTSLNLFDQAAGKEEELSGLMVQALLECSSERSPFCEELVDNPNSFGVDLNVAALDSANESESETGSRGSSKDADCVSPELCPSAGTCIIMDEDDIELRAETSQIDITSPNLGNKNGDQPSFHDGLQLHEDAADLNNSSKVQSTAFNLSGEEAECPFEYEYQEDIIIPVASDGELEDEIASLTACELEQRQECLTEAANCCNVVYIEEDHALVAGAAHNGIVDLTDERSAYSQLCQDIDDPFEVCIDESEVVRLSPQTTHDEDSSQSLHAKLFSYIRAQKQLYSRILRYEPLDFDILYAQIIQEQGLGKCSRKALSAFLDSKAINYVLPSKPAKTEDGKRRRWR